VVNLVWSITENYQAVSVTLEVLLETLFQCCKELIRIPGINKVKNQLFTFFENFVVSLG